MTGQAFTRFGVAIVVFGVILDAVAHGIGDAASAQLGHFVVVLGMVLSLTGVVVDGVRHPRRLEREPHKEVRHALR